MIALSVGWVKRQRNPTLIFNLLGCASLQRHITQVGKPEEREWLPNLQIYFSRQRHKRALIL
jgi:hypothetical protein